MDVLVTGGAGYIGSTICSALSDRGDTPIILDSLVTGQARFCRDFPFYFGDIAQPGILARIKSDFPSCETVIHCAARIIISESVADPHLYFQENVSKGISFLKEAIEFGIDKIIFSSSASVYGHTANDQVDESAPCQPSSPYASSKLMFENILAAYCRAYDAKALCLRYFNPIGADPKLRTGQMIKQPSHLLGRLLDTMHGFSPAFTVFGTDWPTRDGTAIRDYIHVWDLALAHLAAVDYLYDTSPIRGTCEIFNIGTGKGTTVQEFVNGFNLVSPKPVHIEFGSRRDGDVVGAFANPSKAQRLLRWQPKRNIDEGIYDAIQWISSQSERPHNSWQDTVETNLKD